MAIAIDRRRPPGGGILLAILISITLTVVLHALSGNGSGGPADVILPTSKLVGTIDIDATVNPDSRQIKAHAEAVPSGVTPQWEWYAAVDASGTGSRQISGDDGTVSAGIFPGCYLKAIITDAMGRYPGSIESEWTGPVTMTMTGDVEISGVAVGYGPGYRAFGVPLDANGRPIAIERHYEVSSDANGSTPLELDGSGTEGWRIPSSLKGKWMRLVLTPSAEYGDFVFGSIASGWVQVE